MTRKPSRPGAAWRGIGARHDIVAALKRRPAISSAAAQYRKRVAENGGMAQR